MKRDEIRVKFSPEEADQIAIAVGKRPGETLSHAIKIHCLGKREPLGQEKDNNESAPRIQPRDI